MVFPDQYYYSRTARFYWSGMELGPEKAIKYDRNYYRMAGYSEPEPPGLDENVVSRLSQLMVR